jgi:Tol biopolymer transport system component
MTPGFVRLGALVLLTGALGIFGGCYGPVDFGLPAALSIAKSLAGTILGLTATSVTPTSATLQWTAPAATDPSGQISAYELRYATFGPSADNWPRTITAVAPSPAAPGTIQTATVGGLTSGTVYFFRIRALDGSGVPGPVSNLVRVRYAANPRVVFLKERNAVDRWELFSCNLDGSGEVQLSIPVLPGGWVSNFAYSPDLSWVVYRRLQDLSPSSTWELYVVPVGGGASVKISGPELVHQFFRWSPDSSRVAYIATDPTTFFSFRVSTRTGSSVNVKVSGSLTAQSGGSGPPLKWAPDSSRVAFKGMPAGSGVEIYSCGVDGSGLARVSMALPITKEASFFEWAPDSTRVGFSAPIGPSEEELFTAFPDGSGLVQISGPRFTLNLIMFLAWAPDSSFVGYLADEDRAGLWDAYVCRPDGTGRLRVSTGMVAGGRAYWPLEWSPDSTQLAFSGERDVVGVVELYAGRPDASAVTKLSGPLVANGSLFWPFSWSADGSRIAYLARQSTATVTELYTSRADGTGNVKVSGPLVADGNVDSYAWAPDGSRLVYAADQDVDTVNELYAALPDGTGRVKVSGPYVANGYLNMYSWSADASRVLYLARQDSATIAHLYSARADIVQSQVNISGVLTPGGRASSFLGDSGIVGP